MRTATVLRMLVATAAVLVVASAAIAADPTGEWTWTFTRGDQEVELSLDLKLEGDKLSGKLKLPFGDGVEVDIQDGTFKDDTVAFKTVFERDGRSFETKYEGKVEGDTIKGKTERERNGEVVSRDWEANRKK